MDREGLRILDRLLTTTGGSLWRMEATDYRRHCLGGAALAADHAGPALRDASLRRLAAAMAAAGRIVQEEQTALEELSCCVLADARGTGGRSAGSPREPLRERKFRTNVAARVA